MYVRKKKKNKVYNNMQKNFLKKDQDIIKKNCVESEFF